MRRVQRVGGDAVGRQSRAAPHANSIVRRLRLPVGEPRSYARFSKLMSSKSTSPLTCPTELTDTIRASRRGDRVVQPVGQGEVPEVVGGELQFPTFRPYRRSGVAMIPALSTRMCSGPTRRRANAATDPWSRGPAA